MKLTRTERPVAAALTTGARLDLSGRAAGYRPRGATVWLTYALSAAGLVLTTTVATAAARSLRRT